MSMVEDAKVLEYTGQLSDSDFVEKLITGFDEVSKGKKATPIIETLIIAGIVEDPEQMRSVVKANKEAFNTFFETIDYEAFAKNHSEDIIVPALESLKNKIKDQIPAALIGMGVGALSTIALTAVRNRK